MTPTPLSCTGGQRLVLKKSERLVFGKVEVILGVGRKLHGQAEVALLLFRHMPFLLAFWDSLCTPLQLVSHAGCRCMRKTD